MNQTDALQILLDEMNGHIERGTTSPEIEAAFDVVHNLMETLERKQRRAKARRDDARRRRWTREAAAKMFDR